MRIRLRGPSGASTITLGDDATVRDLRASITEKTSLSNFDVKYSYPPKSLQLPSEDTRLDAIGVRLDGEQLTISPREAPTQNSESTQDRKETVASRPAHEIKPPQQAEAPKSQPSGPVALQRKEFDNKDVPELPLPDRGATLVMRVMPDDNSCLFRAISTAVLPGDALSMPELRALVASTIQRESDKYTAVVLEQKPDDYCRWIQTEDAWGGAIELDILSKHFEIEICSIDVQSLRIDHWNEGATTRCILVYSGIHYDTIVQSPSDPPHDRANSPPEFDTRVWDSDDDDILLKAKELCRKLQEKHYYTDTGGMGIRCNICGWTGNGEGQATTHAQQTGHYDMTETN